MEFNLGNPIEKYQSNNKFKSSNLEQLDYTSDNDSKSIIDFDDEYSEVSNLYPKQLKHKKETNKKRRRKYK